MRRTISRLALIGALLGLLVAGQGTCPVEGSTYTVTTTNNLGAGSLRQAILDANANPGLDTIHFAISGCSGVCIIQPTSALPVITDPVYIDGLSQPGASAGNLWAGTGHTLLIELDGSLIMVTASGLTITAGDSTVRGMVINDFKSYGILLSANGGNTIETNYIGTDPTGEFDHGNGVSGILLDNVGSNTIGGSAAGSGNLISGNAQSGIVIQSAQGVSNQIKGNFIGTDRDGEQRLDNGTHGVFLDNAPWNVIGGSAANEPNLISGNGSTGIWISGTGTYFNRVRGNYIGTNRHGTVQPVDLGNGMDGVYIVDSHDNTIGGTGVGEGNLISGNAGSGVRVSGDDSTSNHIYNNYIGTDKYGTAAIPNGSDGVMIVDGASSTNIGGDGVREGNLISGNAENGVSIWNSDSSFNVVEGNLIGTDLAGTAALGNSGYGVRICQMAYYNTVGGDNAAERNVISGNSLGGILVTGVGTTYAIIQGNYIGTDSAGITALPNGGHGVLIEAGAQDSTVGGTSPGQGNRIAFNALDGVHISGGTTLDNDVARNQIYQNGGDGIGLESGANGGISAPAVTGTALASMSVSGTACGSCVVEVFANPDTDGEGRIFLGSTTATAGGSFSLTVKGIPALYLTATATSAANGTSEFSGIFTSSFESLYLPLIAR
jgi:hypothetical protein